MKEKKNPIRNILAVFLGVAVLCVFIEVILQFSGSQDYDIWSKDTLSGLTTYRPNSQFVHSGTCFENMVEVNNIGLHGPVVSIPKGEDTFRILLVGSSFVEALQVQNNQMTSFVLEGKLNESSKGTVRYEVIPLGFSSNGTYLDALYYERYGKALKPDLVILLQTDYEVGVEPPVRYDENGEVIFAYDQTVQDSRIVFLKKQLRKSKMVMNVMDRAHLFVANAKEFLADPFPFLTQEAKIASETTKEPSQEQWAAEINIVHSFARKVEQDHSRFVVATWAQPSATTFTKEELTRRLSVLATQDRFSYLDLTSAMATEEVKTGKATEVPCDGHWSVAGNQYAASALFAHLLDYPELLKK